MKPATEEATMENTEITETPEVIETEVELERLRALDEWPFVIPESDEYV